MKTSAAPHARPLRPLIVRAAHRWYSWTGLALTVVGSYLAYNGQLRVGESAHLYAAGPNPVEWKPSDPPSTTDNSKFHLVPAPDPDDPFRAAAPVVATRPKQPAEKKRIDPSIKTASGTQVRPPVDSPRRPVQSSMPDPFVAPAADVKPTFSAQVKPVLDAYLKGSEVIPARSIAPPGPLPKIEPPPGVVIPPGAAQGTPLVNQRPRVIPIPGALIPLPTPFAADATRARGMALPPIPPPPSPDGSAEAAPILPPLPGVILAQDIETIPVKPRTVKDAGAPPQDKSSEPKELPPPRKRKLIGTLSQDDEIKLNAAQNAARLGDYNRAAALLGEVIERNPKEFDLRAEYAGILLSAGDSRRSIRELEEVIKQAPNVVGYRLLLGDAYMAARQYRAAAEVFMSSLEMVSADPRLADRVPEVVIRAARAYALDQEYFRSAYLVDRHLASIRPDDPRAPVAMGAMLLDLDRPYDALPYLIEKRKQLLKSPEASEEFELKVLEVLASMVRGYARVGDRQQAMDAIQEMATRVPKQTAIRVTLADILFEMNEHELAGHVYNQVLAVEPANGQALIGIARVYLETFQAAAAKKVLDSFIPNPAHQRQYLLAYSSYHQTVGEYTEAKHIYRDMLRRNENDHEVRYALGRLYDFTNEWEKAKAEFAKIPPRDRMARRARLWFGLALLHQRKFAEAAQVAEQFMRDDPNNADGVALHVRALAKMGQFDRSVQSGRGFLSSHPRDERGAATVRLAVGRALLEANRNLDAAREFEIALSKPAGRVPEAYYGLSRAAERLGNADRAQQIIQTLCGSAGADVRNRVLLADLYSQDFEDYKVIEIISGFPGYDDNNLALLIRLADAQQRSARWSGDPADAFATAQTLLRRSPTNVRGHLTMARSFAITQNYRKAAVQYDQLIAIDPDFTIPPRERARVLFSDHQHSAARTQYNVVLSPTPEEIVLGQMAYLSNREARFKQAFAPYLGGQMNGPALRSELARLAATAGDDDLRLAAHRLVCDYDGTLAWQEAFRLERDGKELKDYRNYAAIPQYNAINQFEPTNTETLFDQGQVYGALRMTQAALNWYSNTLSVDPTHRDAAVASERASAEISPKLDVRGDWFSQRGRSGVASIDRQRYLSAVSLPLGDENEFLQLGYMRIAYNPLDDSQVWGNAPFLRAQKKWDDNRLMTYAQVAIEQYEDGGFSTRPTFDVGFWYDHNDVVRTRAGGLLENVAESGESVRQDIYRYGFYVGADIRPTRTWAFGGTYTFAHYSDDNDGHQAFAYNEVSLTLPPKQIKLVQRGNLWAYRDQTVFASNPPNPHDMRGTIHPYFSPDVFSSCECRVEWWHWLSRDYFVHSNQCWYSLQYGIATDNQLVTYHDWRAVFNYDVNSYVTIGAEARALTSDEYDLFSAMAFLQVRFLGH